MGRTRATAGDVIIAAAALAVLVAHATVSSADGRRAATTAAAAPDLSTARSAALAWIDALWAGDAPAAHRILIDDDVQRKFIDPMLRCNTALRALESAAVERFGERGRGVTGYPDGSAKAMEDKVEVEEEGDRATASLDDATLRLHLRRVDGRWHVDLAETMRDPRARRGAVGLDAMADAAKQVAAEIVQGKFKTVGTATAAFRARRLSVRPTTAKLNDVRLYLAEETLQERAGDPDAMAQYLL